MGEDVREIYARQCKLDLGKRRHVGFGSDDLRPVLSVSGKKGCLGAEPEVLDPTLNRAIE